MSYNFDEIIERRSWDAAKWTKYDPDVIPLWVADMDFRSPEPIIRALHERVEHGFFGYQMDAPQLRETLTVRLAARHAWHITPKDILFLPNLVSALNFISSAYTEAGNNVLMLTPAYPPFLHAPVNAKRQTLTSDLAMSKNGQIMRYEIDFDAFEDVITPQTKLFLLCNPHNPIGRMWTRSELEHLAQICLRHNLIICSDEIHCDLSLDASTYTPIATLAPEVAERTITLHSPSKSFNVPSLEFAFAVVTNESLLKQLTQATSDFLPQPSSMGYAAAQAAYTQGQDWLDALLPYLKANRDYVVQYVQEHFPNVSVTCPEATYLAWLDWREADIEGSPFKFFLEKARVAFSDGAAFGKVGEGFARLNFGTPRALLTEALERVRAAL